MNIVNKKTHKKKVVRTDENNVRTSFVYVYSSCVLKFVLLYVPFVCFFFRNENLLFLSET